MGKAPGSDTRRLSGFILPVSTVVDGTTVLRNLSEFLFLCPWVRHNFGTLGAGAALVQCTTCTATQGRLAYLSPAAELTLSFMSPPFSLLSSQSLSSPNSQEGKKEAEAYVSSVYISFSCHPPFFKQLMLPELGFREMWTFSMPQGWQ